MKDKAALVLVTSSFPIDNDGSEAAGSFVSDMAEALAKHLPVRVVAPGVDDRREAWSSNVEVFRYRTPPRALSLLKPWHPGDLRWIARVMRGGLAATRAAVADDTAHVLALWGLPCGEWARRAARERGIGYSAWMLGSDVWSLGRVPVLRGMLARVIRQAEHAYADGYRLAEDAQRIGGVPVAFLPSTRSFGLIDPPMPRAQAPYRLLFLGRWHPNKGVDLLLDALDRLDDDDWRLIERIEFQGGGPLEPLVRKRCADLVARGRPVVAGGFLAKQHAEAAIARCDWILIPSRIESIPIVFSDAMKMRRPVVCTPVGDLPRLIAEGGGLCADAVEAAGIARALCGALRSSTDDFNAGVAETAKRFDLETGVVRRLLQAMDGSNPGASVVTS